MGRPILIKASKGKRERMRCRFRLSVRACGKEERKVGTTVLLGLKEGLGKGKT